jgi:hypothetical protein
MVVVAVIVCAAVFGGADQYLGSFPTLSWAAPASLLSAPWLLIAFIAGCTQRNPKRGALLGLGATAAALVGYGLMTLSPIENAHLGWVSATGFVHSEWRAFAGAVLTGPLFGWFGHRWRIARAWIGAIVTAAAFCLEPLAHDLVSDPVTSAAVAHTEIALGGLMVAYVLLSIGRHRLRHR